MLCIVPCLMLLALAAIAYHCARLINKDHPNYLVTKVLASGTSAFNDNDTGINTTQVLLWPRLVTNKETLVGLKVP